MRQRYAAEEMKFLSQPIDLQLPNFEHYVYDESAGRGVTVYISDTGANLTNTVSSILVDLWSVSDRFKEFTDGSNVAGRVRWLFGQGGGIVNTDQIDVSPLGHGSCVLDKVGGYRYGVAKNVNPVVVRAVHFHADSYIDTVRQIDADYRRIYDQDPENARAIVNLSWGWPESRLTGIRDVWVNELRRLLKGLISRGATVVIPTGNVFGNTVR